MSKVSAITQKTGSMYLTISAQYIRQRYMSRSSGEKKEQITLKTLFCFVGFFNGEDTNVPN